MLLKVSSWAKDRVNPLPSNGYHEGLLWYSKSLLTPYSGAITMRVSDLSQGVDTSSAVISQNSGRFQALNPSKAASPNTSSL